MKHSMPRLMSQAHREILCDSFEELMIAIDKRPETLPVVVELLKTCVLVKGRLDDGRLDEGRLDDATKRKLIEALK